MKMKMSKFNHITKVGNYYIAYNMISKAILLSESHDFSDIKALVENGFIIDDNENELEYCKELFSKASSDNSYMSLTIIPTMECNLRCKYCYQKHEKIQQNLPLITEGIISEISNSPNLKSLHIEWFGGEPSLCLQEIVIMSKEIKNTCDINGIQYSSSINTNLLQVNDSIIDQFKQAHIDEVVTTIAGWKDVHDQLRPDTNKQGTYCTVMENAYNVHKIIPVTLCINFTNSMLKSIDQLYDDLHRFNIDNITICFLNVIDPGYNSLENIFLSDTDYIKTMTRVAKDLMKLGYCVAFDTNFSDGCLYCGTQHINSFTISPDAQLYKCVENFENSSSVGFITKKGFHLYDSCNHMTPYGSGKCQNCDILPYCNGGCSYKKMMKKNYCPDEKNSFDLFLYLYVLSYLQRRNPLLFTKLLNVSEESIKASMIRMEELEII